MSVLEDCTFRTGMLARVRASGEIERIVASGPGPVFYLHGHALPYTKLELASADASPEALDAEMLADVEELITIGESTIWAADPPVLRRWNAVVNRVQDRLDLCRLPGGG
jgi:hypothetical protein